MTAIMLACKSGSLEAVKILYDLEYNLKNQVQSDVLMMASTFN